MTILEKSMLKTVKAYIEYDHIKPSIDLSKKDKEFIYSLKEYYGLTKPQYKYLKGLHEKL